MTQPPEQPFDEASLERALRAPGTADELADEERYVAMFREARASGDAAPIVLPRRRRTARRVGAGSAFVVALAVGGSAAAAYTGSLPDPIQEFAHRALGPVAPPAPDQQRPDRAADRVDVPASPSATSAPTTAPASPTHAPTAAPTHTAKPSRSPEPSSTSTSEPSPTTLSPTAIPTAAPTSESTPTSAVPSATPTETPPPAVGPSPVGAVSISGSTHRVEPGQSVVFAGVVTSETGQPIRKRKVALQVRTDGRWVVVTTGRTDATGQISLVLPPVTQTTGVRLRSGGVRSDRWRVTLHPQVSATSVPTDEPGTVTITATVVGGQDGDRVVLATKAGQVATGTLSGGTVTFQVTPTQKRTRYLILLPGTRAHGPDRAAITVIVKRPQGGG
ncbi:MAG TPA: hypothetical protein DEQ43_25825 [Nocardioides bacterium]|uniref:hypothetical protein n=1 Tax=uncultured Nocardioides sp. TaxID=198441 RepID=UPI000EBFBBBA|nr:hypothetical protein [uncultured Nocardioides sp.]HCB07629.1 hypothetical protein [Nocardioides sp.]